MVKQAISILCNMPEKDAHGCWVKEHDGDLYLSILWDSVKLEFWLTPTEFANIITSRYTEVTDMHYGMKWEVGCSRTSSNTDRDGLFNLRIRSLKTRAVILDALLTTQQFAYLCVGNPFGLDSMAEENLAKVYGAMKEIKVTIPKYERDVATYLANSPESKQALADGYSYITVIHSQSEYYALYRKYTL